MEECSGFPQVGYSEFSDWLHRKVGDQRIPISGSLEVTMRCNLRCQHCYIPMASRSNQTDPKLRLAEIERIVDEVTDAGCLWFLLTGGEPLLRKDFLDIYSYARQKGLILTIFTNGTLITPRIADFLAEWRPFNIEITLYGATQKTYEGVTGIPGSYTRCRQGIDLLLERKVPLGLKTMVMTLNHHELDQMKFLASSLGLKFRIDAIINPALDRSKRPVQFRLKPEDIVEIDRADPERASLWKKEIQEIKVFSTTDHRMYICGAGKQGFHIDALGRMYPCISARNLYYDLRIGNFKEGWEVFLPGELNRQYSEGFLCFRCDLRLVCGQCPAMSYLENGDSEKPIDSICKLTKLRRDTFTMNGIV